MEAMKSLDAVSLFPGNDQEQSDSRSAYTQIWLGGATTWVALPRDRWPDSWIGFINPVCILALNLYGHPDAGAFWEAHCEKSIMQFGWSKINNWRSVYYNKAEHALPIIYVDDFKSAAKWD